MENDNIDIYGISDGYSHYRSANPIALNAFLLIGKKDILIGLNFEDIRFGYDQELGWNNNFNLKYKEEYNQNFDYKFLKHGGENYKFEQEPYYSFLWKLKDNNCKFEYLYPHFDMRFKSTNPRINENSNDIGIHMWYTRSWNSLEDVHGMRNIDRYNLIEDYILSNLL